MTNIRKAIMLFRAAMPKESGVFFVDKRNANEYEISVLDKLYCVVNISTGTVEGV